MNSNLNNPPAVAGGNNPDPAFNLANVYNMFTQLSQAAGLPQQNPVVAPPNPLIPLNNPFFYNASGQNIQPQSRPAHNGTGESSAMGSNANVLQANPLMSLLSGMMSQQGVAPPLQAQIPNSNLMMQNLVNDALRMSVPVGSFPDDEARLVQALYSSERKNLTYRQALEALHGVNNHSSTLWKDYFLDHHKHIIDMVSDLRPSSESPENSASANRRERIAKLSPVTQSAAIGSTGAGAQSSTAHFPLASISHGQKRHPMDLSGLSGSSVMQRTSFTSSRRQTIPRADPRHTTASSSRANGRGRAAAYDSDSSDASDIRLPSPPTRQPTPPSRVEMAPRGVRFTEEDHTFFIQTLQWELGRNPHLTRDKLCKMLSERAPHHTPEAWSRYWSRKNNLVEKVYKVAGAGKPSRVTTHAGPPPEAEKYEYRGQLKALNLARTSASESTSQSQSQSESTPKSQGDPDSEDDDIVAYLPDGEGTDPPTDEDVRNMGVTRGPYTPADMRMLAKYIAAEPDWDNMARSKRFVVYAAKYRRRSAEAYAQMYETRKKAVDRLANKYRRKIRDSKSADGSLEKPLFVMEEEQGEKGEPAALEPAPPSLKRKSVGERSPTVEHGEKRQKVDEAKES